MPTTNANKYPSQIVECGSYSFALVGNGSFIESPRALQSTGVVGRSPGGHFRLSDVRSVGAIKSASRFNNASKIAAQTRMTFNLMAVSCRTFSLGHILISYVFSVVIVIAHSDRYGGVEDDRDGVRRVVLLSQATTAQQKQHLPSKRLRWRCFSAHWGQQRRFDESELTIERCPWSGSAAAMIEGWRGPQASVLMR